MKTSPCLPPYLWWKPNFAGAGRNQRHSDKILNLETVLISVVNRIYLINETEMKQVDLFNKKMTYLKVIVIIKTFVSL